MNDDLPNWPVVVRKAYLKAFHSGSDDDLQKFLKVRSEWLDSCLAGMETLSLPHNLLEDVCNDNKNN